VHRSRSCRDPEVSVGASRARRSIPGDLDDRGVDPELRSQLIVIVVTHNLAQAQRVSDLLAFILDGRLVETGEMRGSSRSRARSDGGVPGRRVRLSAGSHERSLLVAGVVVLVSRGRKRIRAFAPACSASHRPSKRRPRRSCARQARRYGLSGEAADRRQLDPGHRRVTNPNPRAQSWTRRSRSSSSIAQALSSARARTLEPTGCSFMFRTSIRAKAVLFVSDTIAASAKPAKRM